MQSFIRVLVYGFLRWDENPWRREDSVKSISSHRKSKISNLFIPVSCRARFRRDKNGGDWVFERLGIWSGESIDIRFCFGEKQILFRLAIEKNQNKHECNKHQPQFVNKIVIIVSELSSSAFALPSSFYRGEKYTALIEPSSISEELLL